jgi:hypothetical protein
LSAPPFILDTALVDEIVGRLGDSVDAAIADSV